LTVVRGVDNSTARSHNDSAKLEPLITVGFWDDFYDAYDLDHDPADGSHDITKVAVLSGATIQILANKILSSPTISSPTFGGIQSGMILSNPTIALGSLSSVIISSPTIAIGSLSSINISSAIFGDGAPNIAPKARAYLDTSQLNLTNNTWTKVLLVTESYDVGGDFASYKFVAPVSGYYKVDGAILFLTPVADTRYAAGIYVNNALVAQNVTCNGGVTDAISATISDTIYLAATDYVELFARSNSGGNTVDMEAGAASTWMSVHLISI
jgi:hypothetical protein